MKYIMTSIDSGQARISKNDTTELTPIPRLPASGARSARPRIGPAQQAAIFRICFNVCTVLGWFSMAIVLLY
jgi:hypothetical protein